MMSSTANLVYYALWIGHPILQLLIAATMMRRQMHKTFPIFFAYVVSQVLTFAVIFPAYVSHNYWVYFYLYWASAALSSALGFLVIHEIFQDVFRPYHSLRDLGSVLFKWAGLVMLLVAGVVSLSSTDSDLLPWMHAILVAQRGVRIVQCGLIFFLLAFARYLGVSRRQQSFGIALGFGIFAFAELAAVASWVGEHVSTQITNIVNMAAYDAALMVWVGYALAKSPVRQVSSTLLRSQRWEEGLTEIQHPLPPDSLIPMFEGMVDRALARTQSPTALPADLARQLTDTKVTAANAERLAASASGR